MSPVLSQEAQRQTECSIPARFPWDGTTRRLWSLADMIDGKVMFLCQIFSDLARTAASLRDSTMYEIHADMKKTFSRLSCLLAIETFRELLGDDDLQSRVWRLRHQLDGNEHFTNEMLARELSNLQHQVLICISKRKFAYIPPPGDEYFEKETLFGDEVFLAFPDAREDIKDAGNCFAASLDTACVFHLMRVSEHGLRAVAKQLRVSIRDKGRVIPLEFGTWDKVITACHNRIQSARQKHVGRAKQEKLNRYSEAADHCTFMKDIWRNDLAHTRKPYTHDEALAVLGRIRDFMQFLARGTVI